MRLLCLLATLSYLMICTSAVTHKNLHLLPFETCGNISDNVKPSVGVQASLEEFPWMVLLIYFSGFSLDYKCAGTIINERYILTAAHCCTMDLVAVRAGEYDTKSWPIDCTSTGYCSPPVQDIWIEEMIIHKNFNHNFLLNDIALLRLSLPLKFASNVKPICLPVIEPKLEGSEMIIAGWGQNAHGERQYVLRKTSIPVLLIDECRALYQDVILSEQHLCAGGFEGRDSCAGDSGGPLHSITLFQDRARYVQYGITSYGAKSCGHGPGVYIRTSRYLTWILDHIRE